MGRKALISGERVIAVIVSSTTRRERKYLLVESNLSGLERSDMNN
jgi:hypothetical protein